jgi:hypothetical protein
MRVFGRDRQANCRSRLTYCALRTSSRKAALASTGRLQEAGVQQVR